VRVKEKREYRDEGDHPLLRRCKPGDCRAADEPGMVFQSVPSSRQQPVESSMRMLHAHAWRAGVPPEIQKAGDLRNRHRNEFRLPHVCVFCQGMSINCNKRQTAPTPCGVSCTWPAECGIGTRLPIMVMAAQEGTQPARRFVDNDSIGRKHQAVPMPEPAGAEFPVLRSAEFRKESPTSGTPLWEQPGSTRQRTGECRPFRYSDRRMLPEWNGWRPKTGPLRRQSCARRRRSQVRLPAQIQSGQPICIRPAIIVRKRQVPARAQLAPRFRAAAGPSFCGLRSRMRFILRISARLVSRTGGSCRRPPQRPQNRLPGSSVVPGIGGMHARMTAGCRWGQLRKRSIIGHVRDSNQHPTGVSRTH